VRFVQFGRHEAPTVPPKVALGALNEEGPRLAQTYPHLVERVRALLTAWENLGAGRLRDLLPILRELEGITGTSLPLPLRPGAN